ncbi:MAG: thylakoid membrane photosystem I accumulation factor [Pseudanabaenaceae cyanobacterium bins.39]|nr:thylakoid membrane photosystem I accumulation factor [Pseudanabaenaceae cyanobacterium bins.39]
MNGWLNIRAIACLSISVCLAIGLVFSINMQSATAKLTDDAYDGNIFALYGGNGSIVPPRMNLAQSLQQGRAAMLVFYVDDSADCKRFSPILNLAQGLYSKNLSLIAVPVDSLDVQNPDQRSRQLSPTDEAYYYRGSVPQTVLIAADGRVSFDQEGVFGFEELDVAIRDLLGLQDTPPSNKFRKTDRPINEVNP